MANDQLRKAIQQQGELLVKRAEWYQGIIEKQTRVIEKAEQLVESCLIELKASQMAIDSLRSEYKKILSDEESA